MMAIEPMTLTFCEKNTFIDLCDESDISGEEGMMRRIASEPRGKLSRRFPLRLIDDNLIRLKCAPLHEEKGSFLMTSTSDEVHVANADESLPPTGDSGSDCQTECDYDLEWNYKVSETHCPRYVSNAYQQYRAQFQVPMGDRVAIQPHGGAWTTARTTSIEPDASLVATATTGWKQGRKSQVPVTTLMVRNLPCKLSQEGLAKAADELGFTGTYDLVYIPRGASNFVGYGFINFRTPDAASRFASVFSQYSFCTANTVRQVHIKVAKDQGMRKTLEAIRKSGKRSHVPLMLP